MKQPGHGPSPKSSQRPRRRRIRVMDRDRFQGHPGRIHDVVEWNAHFAARPRPRARSSSSGNRGASRCPRARPRPRARSSSPEAIRTRHPPHPPLARLARPGGRRSERRVAAVKIRWARAPRPSQTSPSRDSADGASNDGWRRSKIRWARAPRPSRTSPSRDSADGEPQCR